MDLAKPKTRLQHAGAAVKGSAADSRAEDRELIERFLEGETSAFTKLVNKYRRQVYAIAFRYSKNREEADDLTQETFIKAYENLGGFRMESSFKTWLYRIVTNLSINLGKSGRVSKDSGDMPDDHLSAGQSEALAGLLQDERTRALHAAIHQLPPRQKQTLLLKTYRHMSCEEVAKVMSCSVGTVKANVFNALKRLRSILNPGVEA